ncbi:hypothetical protein [Azospirillum sp. Marseille-Q6669]
MAPLPLHQEEEGRTLQLILLALLWAMGGLPPVAPVGGAEAIPRAASQASTTAQQKDGGNRTETAGVWSPILSGLNQT